MHGSIMGTRQYLPAIRGKSDAVHIMVMPPCLQCFASCNIPQAWLDSLELANGRIDGNELGIDHTKGLKGLLKRLVTEPLGQANHPAWAQVSRAPGPFGKHIPTGDHVGRRRDVIRMAQPLAFSEDHGLKALAGPDLIEKALGRRELPILEVGLPLMREGARTQPLKQRAVNSE